MSKTQVSVSKRAICQRINRKLVEKQQVLKATRGLAAKEEVGDYYVIDPYRNVVVLTRVNLQRLALDLGVIEPWEKLS